ncbi:C4-dicarboxylate transport sensor protein DctB [Piscirickettsia salmonis]|uniref:CHASE domain-containing protein n=1 Tax=Piscirickettsia salmonis TaxID=1238 RepID=UPI0012B913B0|nr:CHASE domain-containing protein [Piscirickettsia salmonis]QGP49744.1 C4-dicarboxylate transport sensor protein DctB [Piscirickettsia salmonis]
MKNNIYLNKLPSFLILITGITISLFLFYSLNKSHNLEASSHFEELATDTQQAIQNNINKNIAALNILKSFYESSHFINFNEFTTFTNSLLERDLAIQALEWIPNIPHSKRHDYVKKANQFFKNFNIKEKTAQGKMLIAKTKTNYFPVYYVNPVRGNEKAIGFDISSSPMRNKSLEKAALTGRNVATHKITLIQEEKGNNYGFLLFNPVYHSSSPQDISPKNLKGFVLGVYRINDILGHALNFAAKNNLIIFVKERINNNTLSPIFQNNGKQEINSHLSYHSTFTVADKKWPITIYPSNDFIKEHKNHLPVIILLAGVIISLILAAYLWLLVNREVRVKNLVEERTEQLNELNSKLTVLNEELDQKVMERSQKLKENQEQLIQSEKLASIGQLAAGVAHEINNPIGYIMNNIEIMGEYLDSIKAITQQAKACSKTLASNDIQIKNDQLQQLKNTLEQEDINYVIDDTEKIIEQSLEGAEKVKNIVLSLKSFAHSDTDNKEEFDLNHCIEQALTITQNELKYKCKIIKNLSPLNPLLGYSSQIGQVIMNLLINAAHAIKESGTITITTQQIAGFNKLTIEDDGHGIHKEHLAKLFDPFFTTKSVGEGTGLGLSISDGIIKKHQGSINVESTVDQGTAFTIHLPNHSH